MNATVESKGKAPRSKSAPSNISVAEYISQQINLCGKPQNDIAREAGFAKPNIISMIKKGDTKLPMSKVGAVARALGVDPVHLFRMVMREYEPETWETLEHDILKQPVFSKNEIEIIELVRQGNVINPKLRTDEERRRLLDAVSTLRPDNATPD